MKADKSCRRHDAMFNALFSASALRWLALAVICIWLAVPAEAAKKASATAAPEASGDAKGAPMKPGPGELLAKAMVAQGQPSAEGNVLMPLAGTWDYQEAFWTDPKTEPQRSMGVATNEMALGGRYISSRMEGTVDIGGQQEPMETREWIGYDPGKKSFSFAAIDTMTPGMVTGAGSFDAKMRVLTENGRFTNPLTWTEQAFRSEIAFVDAEHYTRTVFVAGKSGKETKLIEFDCKRK